MTAGKTAEITIISALVGSLSRLLGLRRGYKRLFVMGLDALLCLAAVWIAFSLRLGVWTLWEKQILVTTVASILFWYPIAAWCGIYRAIFRYAGSGMMVSLVKACLILSIPMIAIFVLFGIPGIPRTIGFLQPMIFLLLLALSRMSARYLFFDVLTQRTYRGVQKGVLIYGAGSAGQQLALAMRHEPSMRLMGFVDDDRRLEGQRLDGVRVYGGHRIPDLIETHGVTDVLLALPNLSRSDRNHIIERLEQYPVHVMTLPNMGQIVDGHVSLNDLRDLNIDDLLGRDAVPPNMLLMSKTILDRTVLVTGAGGSIGSELCRQIIDNRPARLVLVEMSEYALYRIEKELRQSIEEQGGNPDIIVAVLGNIADASICDTIFDQFQPQTVFHAAAYKHVPLVEANPIVGVANNVRATLYAARAAARLGVQNFNLISTDKAVRPTNIMGASKRICELILQAMAQESAGSTTFAMVRFGNVLGSSGSVVPHFQRQIQSGGPVTLTHRDITRYFMTIPEAAALVVQAGAMSRGGEVFVLDMGKSVRIFDLAATMIRLSGLTIRDANNPKGDIEIKEVGLRPGEKLYEELLIGGDPMPTHHSRIMQSNEKFIALAELDSHLESLNRALDNWDVATVMTEIRLLVPEFETAQKMAEQHASSDITA